MGEHYVEFGLLKDHEFSHSFLLCCGCDVVVFDDFVELIDMPHNDPHKCDYVSTQGLQRWILLTVFHLAWSRISPVLLMRLLFE